jgi:hypothetical protein
MTDTMAPFRDLEGIGPATESRLHDAGIWAWADLADVLHTVGGIRGLTVEGLRDLAKTADSRSSDDGDTAAMDNGERGETFLVRLAVGSEGAVVRTSLTHVRSREEHAWAGWDGPAILKLMCWLADIDQADWAEQFDPIQAGSVAASGMHSAERAAPSRARQVVVDGGVVIGGDSQSVELTLDADESSDLDSDSFAYHASLEARPYGHTGWTPIGGVVAGTGTPGMDTVVTFDGIEVPTNLHRLRALVAVQSA